MPSIDDVKIAGISDLKLLLNILYSISDRDAFMLRFYELLRAKKSVLWRIFFLLKLMLQLSKTLTFILRRIYLYYVIYRVEDRIVGYCLLEYRVVDSTLVLRQIYVAPSFRGKGYGSILLRSVIDFMYIVGGKRVFLEVLKNNIPARRVYEKFGFKPVKTYDDIIAYIYEPSIDEK